jgi:hypothetical protein
MNSSQPFNATLRATVLIASATAAVGARYSVQLRIDGVEHGWYLRRLRGNYPYSEYFEGTVQNVPAGNHIFSVAMNMIDTGTITVGGTYVTAQGSPATYPSAKTVGSGQTTLTTAWSNIGNSSTFTSTGPVDLTLQGYLQVDTMTSSTPDRIYWGFSLDGQPPLRTPMVGIQQAADPINGYNLLDYLYNVPPGTHTLSLMARTNNSGNTAVIELPQLEFVGFPADTQFNSQFVPGQELGNQLTVSTQTSEVQPTECLINADFGKWTKLLEYAVPYVNGAYNWSLDGYVQLLGNVTGGGIPVGDVSFEFVEPNGCRINRCFCPNPDPSCFGGDAGFTNFQISTIPDGLSIYGDGMAIGTGSPITFRLYIRKREGGGGTCGTEPCTFQVGDRYMTVRYVPFDNCYYN